MTAGPTSQGYGGPVQRRLVGPALLLMLFELAGCGGSFGDHLTAAKTLTVRGTYRAGCAFDELAKEPRPVLVFSPDGTLLATGSAGPAVVQHLELNGVRCIHAFSVDGVPARYSRYGIQLGRMPAVTFSRSDIGRVRISTVAEEF